MPRWRDHNGQSMVLDTEITERNEMRKMRWEIPHQGSFCLWELALTHAHTWTHDICKFFQSALKMSKIQAWNNMPIVPWSRNDKPEEIKARCYPPTNSTLQCSTEYLTDLESQTNTSGSALLVYGIQEGINTTRQGTHPPRQRPRRPTELSKILTSPGSA